MGLTTSDQRVHKSNQFIRVFPINIEIIKDWTEAGKFLAPF